MKKSLFYLLVVFVFFACNTVPEKERIINSDNFYKKPVVVIDFTGWSCVNCPKAAREIHKMQEKAGNKVIAIAMHPDCHWTVPKGDALDLRSEAATQYYKYFGEPDGFPLGSVDFVEYNGSKIIDYNYWLTVVSQRIMMDEPIVAEISCEVDMQTRKASITSNISRSKETSGKYAFVLLVVENGIVGLQYDGGEYNPNYVFNHVLRDDINGIWGEEFAFDNNKFTKNTEYSIDEKWKIENCQIVGMVLNMETKEIITSCITDIK